MKKNCYLLEVGVLLKPGHPEFGYYSNTYDKKHGYYDEGQCYHRSLEKAKEEALDYVKTGVNQTYAVISETWVDEDIDVKDDDVAVEDETYDVQDVVYSVMKDGDKIRENFIEVRNGVKGCRYTYEVADVLAKRIKEMPEYADFTVTTYGPFGISGESSVSVKSENGDITGSITIHYSGDSESGFSYGKSKEIDSRKNITAEKYLPSDIDEAVACVFEKKRIIEEIAPLIKNLNDRDCVYLHNQMCDLDIHKVFRMTSRIPICDMEGRILSLQKAKDFDENAPYYVVDCINPDEPYYFAKYELRSVDKYDDIYKSPYTTHDRSPREMLADNVAYMGYADILKKIA